MIVALLAASALHLSHAWIVVPTDAPQRRLLEKAGFKIDPAVNHHDGQIKSRRGEVQAEVRMADERLLADRHRFRSYRRNAGQFPVPHVESHGRLDERPFDRDAHSARDAESVSLSIGAYPSHGKGAKNKNRTRRLTALKVIAPAPDRLSPAASYRRQRVTKDFRPDLPLIVRY